MSLVRSRLDVHRRREERQQPNSRRPPVPINKQNPDVKSMSTALKEACPNGIDGHFENVGGYIFDAALQHCNAFARVALCGMIAGYDGAPLPLANPALLLTNRMKIEAFVVSEHLEVWPEA